ncbi:hypothetical protein CSB45_14865 [candidate division KSB3 bacterium]|uniref:Lipopolysaccharide assembly protein A domain-containing protein n=1 Tax=candidate division KSB3 bacterium TaxID=2044937 RepID=A0A2G6E1R4_9BACT|nr:MAG: hypothetical protein CSB45_14865 [candidate division KSB3 bacterium]PIE28349.1 MAG: hypothetical protein CSA57_14345 [candidate division KSB3 bacterium]
MFFVWVFLIIGALSLIVLVDVVLRNPMFTETFVIKVGVPFTQIEYIQENVDFIYIIAGSLLLGAFVIAISTWVVDTKRKLKVRSLRKELKTLQKAVKDAKEKLPQDVELQTRVEADDDGDASEKSFGPEEIKESFKDVVEEEDFLENPFEEGPVEGKVSGRQAGEEEQYSSDENEAASLPQDTVVEAEVVSTDEQVVGDAADSQKVAAGKEASDET